MHRSLFLMLFLWVTGHPAWCGPAPTPVAPPEAPIQAPGDAYDFGSRSTLDQSRIQHTFVLKAGAKAVTVDRMQPSCRCTEAVPVGGMDGYGRFRIAAGRTARVVVTVNPSDMAPGEVEKEVYVFVNGQSTPGVTLHMRGVITPPVVFSVPKLDFGRVPVGEEHRLTLRVTYDSRLLAAGQTAALACSDPRLRLTREDAPLPASATPTRALRYQITTPVGITPGTLNGTLFLALTPAVGSRVSAWSIPVRGEFTARVAGH